MSERARNERIARLSRGRNPRNLDWGGNPYAQRALAENMRLGAFIDGVTGDYENLGLYVSGGKFNASLGASDYARGRQFTNDEINAVIESLKKIGENVKVSRATNGSNSEQLNISFNLKDYIREGEENYQRGFGGRRIR